MTRTGKDGAGKRRSSGPRLGAPSSGLAEAEEMNLVLTGKKPAPPFRQRAPKPPRPELEGQISFDELANEAHELEGSTEA